MLAFRMGKKSEGVLPEAKMLQGGMESQGVGGAQKDVYLSVMLRGVFENHFWEVLADPESFWLPDKLALNQ